MDSMGDIHCFKIGDVKMNKTIRQNDSLYLMKELSIDNIKQVSELFNHCNDYFFLVGNQNATQKDVNEFFEDLPPGKNMDDKYLFGVYYKETLIGVIDLVHDYPEKGEWIIGLMLLHPSERGKGLGKAIHDVIVDIANENKVKKLRIGVVKQNKKALEYWKHIGYKEIKRTQPIKYGSRECIVIVMNYMLDKN